VAKPLDALSANFNAGFAKKLIGEQTSAHSYLAMDPPNREFDTLCIERLLPCNNMLIDAINERPVEIKQEGRTQAISPVLELACLNEDGACQSAKRLWQRTAWLFAADSLKNPASE